MCDLHPETLWELDSCIAPIVDALGQAGIGTVASCCGHGTALGTIALSDGRELIIAPDYATARAMMKGPNIYGCSSNATETGEDDA